MSLVPNKGTVQCDGESQVPPDEQWLHNNKAAMESVQRGLDQAAAGEVHDLGSFADWAGLDVEINDTI